VETRGDPIRWLRALLERERDPARLRRLVLDAALELLAAERGYLVRRRASGELEVEVALGFDADELRGPAGQISRTAVERVLERSRGLVTASEEDWEVGDATSLRQSRVTCVACVPVRGGGEVWGVLYLDHRFDPAAFVPEDLEPLQALADLAGERLVALEE